MREQGNVGTGRLISAFLSAQCITLAIFVVWFLTFVEEPGPNETWLSMLILTCLLFLAFFLYVTPLAASFAILVVKIGKTLGINSVIYFSISGALIAEFIWLISVALLQLIVSGDPLVSSLLFSSTMTAAVIVAGSFGGIVFWKLAYG